MDIFAHALWAGAGVAAARRRWPLAPRIIALTVALAALPDILHLLPILAWWAFGDGSMTTLQAYAIAVPDHEPGLPPLVNLLSHHLHCIMHSAIVAGAVTLLLWVVRRSLWIPLLGWWSHIVIDVFTHSAAYYPVPVLYPITERGFDGLALEHTVVPTAELCGTCRGRRMAGAYRSPPGWPSTKCRCRKQIRGSISLQLH
ncbi:MAG: metal-dependent hydrolase [Betaproteobacteria bacterium]|nr:metal-dependent hydrolase [Betaproteobacteria bacterium]